ncbi:alpha/beta hydrolase [Falsiroseomonas selenitidurans]|uniref:Alpha/beta fold hydrolase n=1 Tax=Falsiroseomonas selenitidurans TaxID=2716335 RepID=A0ABX1E197_9PROT|nr:alpha/beta fold hydrolase [Falsiroseomonas selenitidurans]NKC30929.1 alpha/beta fold hydrolase [Falsiroseomonas selenitidurans]
MSSETSLQEEVGHLHGRLAWARLPGRGPGVVFLSGFRSDMQGAKALALRNHCAAGGRAFLRFDYSGHGESAGRFEDGTISDWAADALLVFDALTEGPQILVGSSMGGWIGLLLANARPARLAGFIGIAPAPDFTELLMWPAFSDAQRAELMDQGVLHLPSAYGEPTPVTRALFEDGRRRSVLDRPLSLPCPVRILQGMADPDVPWRHALRLVDALSHGDVRLHLIKDGDHRLSRAEDLRLLTETLDSLGG